MLETVLTAFVEEVKKKVAEFEQEVTLHSDFRQLEDLMVSLTNQVLATTVTTVRERVLTRPAWVSALKRFGREHGLRFKGYRSTTVYVYPGLRMPLKSPYFVPRQKKRGRKKRGPNGRGIHLGLAVLGVVKRGSPQFVSDTGKLAVLCPSFDLANEVLRDRGISLNVKTIRRYCRDLGEVGLVHRGKISLRDEAALAGQTLVIGIDGGRIRERRPKRGRRKQGARHQGYHTNWKEPKLFTSYALDAQGKLVTAFPPIHDATMGNDDAVFAVLTAYLQHLDLGLVARIVFLGDGAPWIWPRVERLIEAFGLDRSRVYQVLDYAHAAQNLSEIVELVPLKHRQQTFRRWKTLLFYGRIAELGDAIRTTLKGGKRTRGVKKWRRYFQKHALRMQYHTFQTAHIPCGSGHVESAIRRVINLRLNAPGTLWTRKMAEYFLFLRSPLLSGRWQIFMKNVSRRWSPAFT